MWLWNIKICVVYFDQCKNVLNYVFTCFWKIWIQERMRKNPKLMLSWEPENHFHYLCLISTLQKEEWGAWKKIEQGSEWAAQMLVKIYNKCHNLVIMLASSIRLLFWASLSFWIRLVALFLNFLYFSRSSHFSPGVVFISFLALSLCSITSLVSGWRPGM